jgi:hypothetical protein
LLKQLGFNKDAPLETQKAFVKHLIQAANNSDIARTQSTSAVPKENTQTNSRNSPPAQLSFDPDILGFSNHDPMYRKTKPQR